MSNIVTFNDDNLCKTLTDEEIRKRCPHAFDSAPTDPTLSKHYAFVSTARVIEDMRSLGWNPVAARQAKHRGSTPNSWHYIAFQNPDVCICTEDGKVESYPRVLLINSHDGTASFKFMIGLFRLVCSNGLVISDETFADIRIRHIEYNRGELETVVKMAMDALPGQVKLLNDMKSRTLTLEEKRGLAMDAVKIRRNQRNETSPNMVLDPATLDKILTPRRPEDNGNDLYTVFNVVQEAMIKGGFSIGFTNGKGEVKDRKQRPITAARRDLELNTKMFQLATNLLAA